MAERALNELRKEYYEKSIDGVIGSTQVKMGWWDYQDTATATTPISVPGTNTFVDLTNNGSGSFTTNAYALPSASQIWDTADNSFDLSILDIGDIVNARLTMVVNTSAANAGVSISAFGAYGTGSQYEIAIAPDMFFKSSGDHVVSTDLHMYVGNSVTKDNPLKLRIKSDTAATVEVTGWYVWTITR